jgi:hypothetical protein
VVRGRLEAASGASRARAVRPESHAVCRAPSTELCLRILDAICQTWQLKVQIQGTVFSFTFQPAATRDKGNRHRAAIARSFLGRRTPGTGAAVTRSPALWGVSSRRAAKSGVAALARRRYGGGKRACAFGANAAGGGIEASCRPRRESGVGGRKAGRQRG